jgi:hypothetical protein
MMQNFTGSWARAAGQPMPGAVNPMKQPGAGDGSGGGQMIGSLRPKPNPNAGLNEPKPKSGWIDGVLGMFMNQMMGIKSKPKPKAAPAPAAGLTDPSSTPNRMDRASKLFSIGAGLMD